MLDIVRPREGRILGGVCAGIADHFGWQRRTVRTTLLISCLLPGPQFVLYLAAWIVLPDQPRPIRVIDIEEVRERAAA